MQSCPGMSYRAFAQLRVYSLLEGGSTRDSERVETVKDWSKDSKLGLQA